LVAAVDIKSTSPGNNGYTLAVVFKIDDSSANEFTGFWKYGKKSAGEGVASEWYDYGTKADNNDGTGYEISTDKKTLTVYLVDGKLGDNDWQINAEIIDPALPIVQAAAVASNVNAIPTLSAWALLMLTGLMGVFGFKARNKK
jgi:hypothetical protein